MNQMAGQRLIEFFTLNPLGEELLEGTMGGAMAGAAQLGSDQSMAQTALETAAAIAGGIGMGMLGRRLGARVGKAIHKQPLSNQQGMAASIGRLGGSETTAQGVKHQGQMMKSAIQQGLLEETSSRMVREAAEDPAAFARRYGISAELLNSQLPQVQAGQRAAAAARMVEQMPPEQRKAVLDKILSKYQEVEQAIAREASGSVDDMIQAASTAMAGEKLGSRDIGEALQSLLQPVPPVTGEHVGRAVGRFLGDEVGIMGGLMGGSLLAGALGLESPKDKKIRELEAQLAR